MVETPETEKPVETVKTSDADKPILVDSDKPILMDSKTTTSSDNDANGEEARPKKMVKETNQKLKHLKQTLMKSFKKKRTQFQRTFLSVQLNLKMMNQPKSGVNVLITGDPTKQKTLAQSLESKVTEK